jgi:MoaA/NifB/PqqE/SkfB family radical SAM enzyme
MTIAPSDRWWGFECPELAELVKAIQLNELDSTESAVVNAHLAYPTATVASLRRQICATNEQVQRAYTFIQSAPDVKALVTSHFYHHRLRNAFAATTVSEWLAEPGRPERILARQPVIPMTVEIHPSKGTCNYQCVMCLWSDRTDLTYHRQRLMGDGLLTTDQWLHLLDGLASLGVSTVVISGGGEALLNRDLAVILARARQLHLRRHIYTTGFNLTTASDALWGELAKCDQVRFSIHAADPDAYDRIVGLPSRLRTFAQVTDNLKRLIALRGEIGGPGRVGAGMVTQPANYNQIESMARFAADVALDFLNVRKDEVDVTSALSAAQTQALIAQIRLVRSAAQCGSYGSTVVDFSDELTALANGVPIERRRTGECRAKYFRPTISPFGLLAPCDLKAEPRFADTAFNLGLATVGAARFIAELAERAIPDACAQCMPSSRTGNAVYAKLLADYVDGFSLQHQPFVPPPRGATVR